MHPTLKEQSKYSVIVPFDLNSCFAYSYDEDLQVGQLVAVSFRNREVVGVISSSCCDYGGNIKQVSSVLPYAISDPYIKFCEFVAQYTMNSIGNIMRLIVPFSIDKILIEEKNIKPILLDKSPSEIVLTKDQLKALDEMKGACNGFKAVLLHGMTGSGKTEVFLEFIRGMEQVLILVPEISLSSELAKKVSERIGVPVYIWHHSITSAKKRDIWKKAINGEKIVIVGARSALFIPFSSLNCIVIDEEHDSSLKQSEGIIYHARDMGIYLARLLNIPIILSSATPSLESYSNAISGKYGHILLKSRFFESERSSLIHIDDLRKQKGILSEYSFKSIEQCLAKNKQAMVFVNRRGHTPKILCSSCGWKVTCSRCDTWLCYHANQNCFICHHCGFKSAPLKKCKECGEESLIGVGSGVEKVATFIAETFPCASVMNLSSDNMDTPNKISKMLQKIVRHEIDIVVGTQIMAKGHNFPDLNTIIITCLDDMLYGDDFRTAEKAFQLTYQVAGRAGRFQESEGAHIVYQTYNPSDALVQLIASGNIEKFYGIELFNRKMTKMPPFGKMISILISSRSEKSLGDFSRELVRFEPRSRYFKVLGPLVPAVSKINNIYRLRFIVSSEKYAHNYVKQWFSVVKIPKDIKVSMDVDPYDFF